MEEQSVKTAEQEIGYGCICGFSTPDKKEFTNHVMLSARKDGRGTHKSIGRVNMKTGEIVARPWAERSRQEKKETKYKTTPSSGGGGGAVISEEEKKGKIFTTTLAVEAQQIRLVPKVFTMDYTPILRAAQDAATKYFGWRPDMPLDNFIDTCLYHFFLEKGVTLCGYIVDESLLKKEGDNNGG